MKSLVDQFDEWLGGINYSKDDDCAKTYPFWLRVGCVKAAPPRHERFAFLLEMGSSQIDDVFQGNSLRSADLTFVFPERHMSVHEQYCFMSALKKHPDAKSGKIKTVDILTSSAIMISNFHREQILILTWDDDKLVKDL